MLQRGEAKLLSEDWEGAVQDLKEAAQKSPQVNFIWFGNAEFGWCTQTVVLGFYSCKLPMVLPPKPPPTHPSPLLEEPSLLSICTDRISRIAIQAFSFPALSPQS